MPSRAQWHTPDPESLNIWPSTGMNAQLYPPFRSLNDATPQTLAVTSLFNALALTSYRGAPPVPTVNCRMPLTGTSNATRPTPSFTFTPTAPPMNQPVRFDASATQDEGAACLDACSYSWNFGDGSTASGRIVSKTFTAGRTYTVSLTVTDAAGTSASTAQAVTVATVVAPAAPTVTLAVSPNPPIADQAATFTATAAPATGHAIVSYAWDFGNGTTSTTTGPTVTKTYTVVGTYVATVTVTDDLGQTASVSASFTIISRGVTASFTMSPTNPIPAQTVNFNVVASTGAGGSTISAWSWNFGDGLTDESEEPTTSHAYTLAGAYIVRLTVTDSSGRTGTTTQTLTVAAAD